MSGFRISLGKVLDFYVHHVGELWELPNDVVPATRHEPYTFRSLPYAADPKNDATHHGNLNTWCLRFEVNKKADLLV
jgi:hypothetical protein